MEIHTDDTESSKGEQLAEKVCPALHPGVIYCLFKKLIGCVIACLVLQPPGGMMVALTHDKGLNVVCALLNY